MSGGWILYKEYLLVTFFDSMRDLVSIQNSEDNFCLLLGLTGCLTGNVKRTHCLRSCQDETNYIENRKILWYQISSESNL